MEKVNRVFSLEQEKRIVEYTKKIAKMFYGLPVVEFLKLVYSYAIAVGSKVIPEAWEREQSAPRDWYYGFMKRHPTLTLKTPEGMSIARITAFNKTNVELFFNVYTEAVEKYNFAPDRIFNLDESSLTTVMKPVKVLCEKGKPVASQISRERGASMTFVGIVNAAGSFIPPVFIIPRKRWNDAFMRGTIHGSKGLLHQNGWMNGDLFLETLQHIQRKTYCSPDNKILLIMDNAECHMNIHAVEFANENGIVIVTLPPHTTAKLQPLDVSIFGPFKTHMRVLQKDFHLTHPNKLLTEHHLPELACKAWIKACTPANVLSGFAATGIWPIDRNIFPDDAFAGAEVTEQPPPPETDAEEQDLVLDLQAMPPSANSSVSASPTQTPETATTGILDVDAFGPSGMASPSPSGIASGPSGMAPPGPSGIASGPSCMAPPGPSGIASGPSGMASPGPSGIASGPSGMASPGPSGLASPGPSGLSSPSPSGSVTLGPSGVTPVRSAPIISGSTTSTPESSASSTIGLSPEAIRPYPKAAARPVGKGRKRVKACILTENAEAISDLRAKEEKKRKTNEKKRQAEEKKTPPQAKRRKVQRRINLEVQEEEEEEETGPLILDDSSEYSEEEVDDPSDTIGQAYPFQEKEPEVRNLSRLV